MNTMKIFSIMMLALALLSTVMAGGADMDCATLDKKNCKKAKKLVQCRWKGKPGKNKGGKCVELGAEYCDGKGETICKSKKYKKFCKWSNGVCKLPGYGA